MPSFKVDGMDEFVNLCLKTDRTLTRVIGKSIYPAGKHMGNAIKKSLKNIKEDSGSHRHGLRKGPTSAQKKALIESYGIAKMHAGSNGYNVKIGFDGYNGIVTKKYPKGQPNAMIARSVNSGTSFMEAQPFMDATVAKETDATVEIIKDRFENEMQKLWK